MPGYRYQEYRDLIGMLLKWFELINNVIRKVQVKNSCFSMYIKLYLLSSCFSV